jgi:hypothetical protein
VELLQEAQASQVLQQHDKEDKAKLYIAVLTKT